MHPTSNQAKERPHGTVDGALVVLPGEAVLRVPETLPDTKMVVMGEQDW